ncbi:hypothetical protein PMAYCL1PPCAC_09979, partial [Pristionchus mayeri]
MRAAVIISVTCLALGWSMPMDIKEASDGVKLIASSDADTRATDTEFQTLVDNMRSGDADKPSSSQYKLTWGTKLGSNPQPSGKNLMSNVDESLFSKAVYSNLKKMYDNNIFNPDVCVSESDYKSGFKSTIIQDLLTSWSSTKPFSLMHDYLVKKGKVSSDMTEFKKFLTTFWF